MRIYDAPILVLDTETTGVDVSTVRIVEIGGADFEGPFSLGPPFVSRVNPGEPIPAEASQVHGIYDADVSDAPTFSQIAARLVERVRATPRPVLSGYNFRDYDGPLLRAELRRAGLDGDLFDEREALDPIIWLRWKFRHWKSRKLADVCERFGHPLKDAHTAAADAFAAGLVLGSLLFAGEIPDNVEKALRRQDEIVRVLDEERAAWSHYLYRDRAGSAPKIRIGFGKHVGHALEDVPGPYLRFCLETFGDDLPPDVRALFLRRIG